MLSVLIFATSPISLKFSRFQDNESLCWKNSFPEKSSPNNCKLILLTPKGRMKPKSKVSKLDLKRLWNCFLAAVLFLSVLHMCTVQRATCNVQYAMSNVQYAMCNVQRTCLQICETATQLVGRHKTCKVFLLISPMLQPIICGWFRFEQYSSRFSYSFLSYNFLPVYYYLVSKGKRNVNVNFHEIN